jgi:two-component system phosphate regulon sensor histidine kinase PhoR
MKTALCLNELGTPTAGFDSSDNKTNKDDSRRFVYQVAHDMQSPLTALTSILKYCTELDEAKRAILCSASQRLQDMTQSLLEDYRLETGQQTPGKQRQKVRCAALLHQLVLEKQAEYAQYPNLFVEHIAPNAPLTEIFACPVELGRALSNLINNAVEALPDKTKGTVTIGLEVVKSGVKLSICDDGVGMLDLAVRKLSQRVSFTSGKANGHGLGMTQVWEMLERNQGKMIVRSKLGKGTRIELIFSDAGK